MVCRARAFGIFILSWIGNTSLAIAAAPACQELLAGQDEVLSAIYFGLKSRSLAERTPDLTVVVDRLMELGHLDEAEFLRAKLTVDPWEHWEATPWDRVRSEALARLFRRHVLPQYHRPTDGIRVREFGGRPLVEASVSALAEFLQKAKPDEIKVLPPIYLLKLTGGTDQGVVNVFRRYRELFRDLRHLDLTDIDVSGRLLSERGVPSSLESLVLSRRRIRHLLPADGVPLLSSSVLDRAVANGKLKRLRNLDVSWSAVGGESLGLADFPANLEALKITGLGGTGGTPYRGSVTSRHFIDALEGGKFDDLRYLDISEAGVDGVVFSHALFPPLKGLIVRGLDGGAVGPSVHDTDFRKAFEANKLQSLVFLDISSSHSDGSFFSHPGAPQGLERLSAEYCFGSTETFKRGLVALTRLDRLNISHTQIDGAVFVHRDFPKKIRSLEVEDVDHIDDTDWLAAFQRGVFEFLKELSLHETPATGKIFANRSFPSGLESLHLRRSLLSVNNGHFLAAFRQKKLQKLRHLDIRSVGVTETLLTYQGFPTGLESLGVGAGQQRLRRITAKTLQKAASQKKLDHLWLLTTDHLEIPDRSFLSPDLIWENFP